VHVKLYNFRVFILEGQSVELEFPMKIRQNAQSESCCKLQLSSRDFVVYSEPLQCWLLFSVSLREYQILYYHVSTFSSVMIFVLFTKKKIITRQCYWPKTNVDESLGVTRKWSTTTQYKPNATTQNCLNLLEHKKIPQSFF